MARNSGGTYSLPSGNPVVTGTTITSTWANTTLTDVGSEITNSLDRNGKGAMLSPLKLPNGTKTLPALTFDTDTDCGLYRASAGNLRMSVDDTDIQTWTSTAIALAKAVTASVGVTVTTTTVNGDAVTATGNGTGAGLSATAGTAATGGTRQDAAKLTNGDLSLSGVANPSSTTGLTNRLTPMGLVKCWGRFTADGVGGVACSAGMNVASVSNPVGTTFRVTMASGFSAGSVTANVCLVVNAEGATRVFYGAALNSDSTIDVVGYDDAGGAALNFANTPAVFHLIAFGPQ